MAFDVPYVINGSKHSARLFRRQHQNQSGEGSGVTRAGDLVVEPLNVPGPGFRVAPGGATVQSRDTTASSRESYGPINDQEIVVDGVPGTGSGETRRDLVILEVTDPQMESVTYPEPTTEEGWQDGDNFCRITIIQNVDSLVPAPERPVTSLDQITTGAYANVSGVALAAITYPASTSTISEEMIEDLRVVQSPFRAFEQRSITLSETQRLDAMSHPGQTFPTEFTDVTQRVHIPERATHMRLTMIWGSVKMPAGSNAGGRYYIQVGENVHPDVVRTKTGYFDGDGATNLQTDTWVIGDTRVIPESMRGTSEYFFGRAYFENSPSTAHRPYLNSSSSVILNIDFFEQAS